MRSLMIIIEAEPVGDGYLVKASFDKDKPEMKLDIGNAMENGLISRIEKQVKSYLGIAEGRGE